MPVFKVSCHSCSHITEYDRLLGRTDTCSECDADLKVCLNCKFHDRSAPQQCREPTAEYVSKKDRANFCGAFEPSGGGNASADSAADDARAKLDSLFKL